MLTSDSASSSSQPFSAPSSICSSSPVVTCPKANRSNPKRVQLAINDMIETKLPINHKPKSEKGIDTWAREVCS